MPYQVQQIIQGKGMPSCVEKDDTVAKALAMMIEHDFSQLPVIQKEQDFDAPLGMVTYEGILRGIRNFNAKIDDLKVRDVMVTAPIYSLEEDLFDILDRLKETNAVLITDNRGFGPDLVGIVTSFDTAEYFRNRTEDLMRVEDIELMIKEFIKAAYVDEKGDFDELKLNSAVTQMTAYKKGDGPSEKQLLFSDLSLGDYVSLLLLKETWSFTESIFGVQRNFVNELLQGVREIRNALAHFRGDISSEQRDKLKFAAEWLTRCQAEHHARLEKAEHEKILKLFRKTETIEETLSINEAATVYTVDSLSGVSSTDFAVTESATGGGRYAALADWLQSQPGRIDRAQLTFNQIEEIIAADLPASARNHRAWWANDAISHSHSQLWLDAGWRTTYVNLTEGKVNFSRIREREKAYITFFSKLLDEFKKKSNFSVRDINPDGASWIVIQTVPTNGPSCGSFNFSFSRDKRLRVELYLDLGEKEATKSVFDKLYAQRGGIESDVGKVEWERLDNRRASRIALYHDGYILETKSHAELRKWAAESMAKFCGVMSRLVDHAISEVKNG
jgi:CBS domain-containing protein